MPKITEVIDSETDNITSNKSRYIGCGVAGTSEATKPIRPTMTELRESQANEVLADFDQQPDVKE